MSDHRAELSRHACLGRPTCAGMGLSIANGFGQHESFSGELSYTQLVPPTVSHLLPNYPPPDITYDIGDRARASRNDMRIDHPRGSCG